MKTSSFVFNVIMLALICTTVNHAQYRGHDLAISVNYSFTASSKLFLFPKSTDIFLRDRHKVLDDIFSPSIDIRYKISNDIVLGFSVEYIEKLGLNTIILAGSSGNELVNVDEGYSMTPFEFSGYYLLPFSTENFKFNMGAGFGIYTGKHLREINGVELDNIGRNFAYGIHVSIGMDYMIKDYLSVRSEMRFRDPQVEVTSKYSSNNVIYGDRQFVLPGNSFDSKINVDGITFTVGIVYHLL
ncbi:MAG: hypothetical protein JW995_00185 [Melioribacteraceae bacterium]|nr:hypothetical protein [Melioribacteraceae bacterium]